MRRLSIVVALATLAALTCPAAFGDDTTSRFFEVYDKNGDGRVTPDEIEVAGEVFRLLDRNKDGAITPEDLRPATDARPRPGPERGAGMLERLKGMDLDDDGKISRDEFKGPASFFDRLDANGDGFVDGTEMQNAGRRDAGRSGPGEGGGPPMERLRRRFQEMDANSDGKVSADEYRGRIPFERLDGNGDGFLDAADLEGLRPGGADGPPRQPFESMDRNGDGKVTKDEYRGNTPFERLDRNGDGVLDGEDLRGAGSGDAGRGPGERPDRRKLREAMKAMDTDGDGKISKDEYTGPIPFERLDRDNDGFLTEKDRQAGGRRGRELDPEAVKERFRRADANGDGKLDASEFPRPEMFQRLDENGDGYLTPEELERARQRGRQGRGGRGGGQGSQGQGLDRFDRDGDGRISRDEFPGSDERFEQLDRNQDGWITPDEQGGAPRSPRPGGSGPGGR